MRAAAPAGTPDIDVGAGAEQRTARTRRVGSAGRLASLHAAVLAVALGVVVIALVRSFTASYESAAATGLGTQLREFQRDAIARPSGEGLRAFSYRFLSEHPLPSGSAVVVAISGSGLVVTGDTASLVRAPRVRRWFSSPPVATVAYAATVGAKPLEIVASPIKEGNKAVGTYIATSDLTPFVEERARVIRLSLAEATIALLVGVASAFVLLRRLLRRIGRITTTAGEIGSGSLERRLGSQTDTDEVGDLARTFDDMLDRVETAMQAQRRLLADVSHQLRTPVTVVRGHLEVLNRSGDADVESVRETVDLVIDELDQMTAQIERLLTLGRAMETDRLDLEVVSLRDVVAPLLDSVRPLATGRLSLGEVDELKVRVDRHQLRGAITCLLDNAARATGKGGSIELAAATDPLTGGLAIDVEDSGPGIPAAQREAVLQRFSRPGARDEDGSGLGLAIAKAVAIAHGGEVQIDRSPQLGGARVRIMLPRSVIVPGGERT